MPDTPEDDPVLLGNVVDDPDKLNEVPEDQRLEVDDHSDHEPAPDAADLDTS